MTRTLRWAAVGAAGALVAAAGVSAAPGADADHLSPVAQARIHDAGGNRVGTLVITRAARGIFRVSAAVRGQSEGFHGFHLHTTGVCDPDADPPFGSAGGHLNPGGADHGEHAGDLPNMMVIANGGGVMETVSDRFSLSDLFDRDGTAVIVHAAPDNHANIPDRYGGPDEATLATGDAGGRAACGVLRRR